MIKKIIGIIFFIIMITPIFSAMEIVDNNYKENDFIIITPTEILMEGWEYSGGVFCADFPAINVNFSLVWRIDTNGIFNLFLIFTHEYQFEYYFDNSTGTDYEYQSFGYVEISNNEESTWDTLAIYTGNGSETENIDITSWAGGNLSIRFRCLGVGDNYFSSNQGGNWCLEEIKVQGMQDNNAPMSIIDITGNLEDIGWYNTQVIVDITATDQTSGVKEIHYILDGDENAVINEAISFTISDSGEHTLEYWAIDNVGNEEEHHTIPNIKIDIDKPTVNILLPEPGLYLFGNKILSIDNIILIGSFTIETAVEDEHSGIYRTQFYLDDILFQESTGQILSLTCSEQHFGTGILKVTAEDLVHNTNEDAIEIIYYKFLP